MRPERRLPLLLATLLVAGCAAEPPRPAPRPAPVPQPVAPRPAPPPVVQPVPVQPGTGWQDMELTPGTWSYDEQRVQASFGSGATSFSLRCDRQNRQVHLLRPGVTTGNVMRIQTTEMTRALPISITPDASATPYVNLSALDPLLDGIAFSRGRFSVDISGLPNMIMPAWPEPARVVEECRG